MTKESETGIKRFVLVYGANDRYVSSWDTWDQAKYAFDATNENRISPHFKLIDNATGHVWKAGAERKEYIPGLKDRVEPES